MYDYGLAIVAPTSLCLCPGWTFQHLPGFMCVLCLCVRVRACVRVSTFNMYHSLSLSGYSLVDTMTERAVQLHHDNAPAHSTALVQAFFGQRITSPRSVSPTPHPLQPRFGSLRFLAFPKVKIAFEKEEIWTATVTQYSSSVNGVSLPTD